MINFTAAISEADVKIFVSHKMQLKTMKVKAPFIIYGIAILFMLFFTTLLNMGLLGWIMVLILVAIFVFSAYRLYSTYKKTVTSALDLINKKREFTMDDRKLNIFCKDFERYSGSYSMYELKEYFTCESAFYLDFSGKDFIIIPRYELTKEQDAEILKILEKRVPANPNNK